MSKEVQTDVRVTIRFKPDDYKMVLKMCDPGETANKMIKRRIMVAAGLIDKANTIKKAITKNKSKK